MQKTLNRDDIIRMAREVGLPPCAYSDYGNQIGNLESFAALVAAAERERIIATNAPEIEKVNVYIKALEDAVAVEREACAKVCDEMAAQSDIGETWIEDCATAIRARGQG